MIVLKKETVTVNFCMMTLEEKNEIETRFKGPTTLPSLFRCEKKNKRRRAAPKRLYVEHVYFFDDKRYITPYSTKNTHWKIQDISR